MHSTYSDVFAFRVWFPSFTDWYTCLHSLVDISDPFISHHNHKVIMLYFILLDISCIQVLQTKLGFMYLSFIKYWFLLCIYGYT